MTGTCENCEYEQVEVRRYEVYAHNGGKQGIKWFCHFCATTYLSKASHESPIATEAEKNIMRSLGWLSNYFTARLNRLEDLVQDLRKQ